MERKNNKIVCDLNKVQWAEFKYVNQHGGVWYSKPSAITVRGIYYGPEELAVHHPDYPNETAIARAKRLGIVDVWTAKLTLKFSANETLIYTGDKAKDIYKAWCAKIYGKNKQSK